jgi:hypothetical protein
VTSLQPTPLHAYVLDPLERALSTFVQQWTILILPALALTGTGRLGITGSQLLAATDVSGFAFLISLAMSVATFKVPPLPVAADLIVRVLRTYVQSVVATVTAATVLPSVLHADWRTALVGAVPVAGTALLKGLASLAAPWSVGASLLPMIASLYRHPASGTHPAYAATAAAQAATSAAPVPTPPGVVPASPAPVAPASITNPGIAAPAVNTTANAVPAPAPLTPGSPSGA